MKTDRLLLDHIRRVLEAEGSLEAKAQRISQMIRAAGVYRWVGIYAVEGEEIVCPAWSGQDAPAHPRFPRSQGLSGAPVTGATVGLIDGESEHLNAFTDDDRAFFEECASVLANLYR